MKNSCFLAPVHPPKYEYAREFIASYNGRFDDQDIFLLFTNDNDKEGFERAYPELKYQSIVYDNSVPLNDNVVNVKKLYGIQWIFDNTNFTKIGVVDVDSSFFRTVDYDELFENHIKNGVIYGTQVPLQGWIPAIIKDPARFVPEDKKQIIVDQTKDYRVYFWFNEIPVYEKEKFLEFAQTFKLSEIGVYDFEYVAYAYFLMSRGYMELKVLDYDIPVAGGSLLEFQDKIPNEIFREQFLIMNPMWIKLKIAEQDMKNSFMLIHLDRK
jgi:hypothetical protein